MKTFVIRFVVLFSVWVLPAYWFAYLTKQSPDDSMLESLSGFFTGTWFIFGGAMLVLFFIRSVNEHDGIQ